MARRSRITAWSGCSDMVSAKGSICARHMTTLSFGRPAQSVAVLACPLSPWPASCANHTCDRCDLFGSGIVAQRRRPPSKPLMSERGAFLSRTRGYDRRTGPVSYLMAFSSWLRWSTVTSWLTEPPLGGVPFAPRRPEGLADNHASAGCASPGPAFVPVRSPCATNQLSRCPSG
jgi:hypothetical protein